MRSDLKLSDLTSYKPGADQAVASIHKILHRLGQLTLYYICPINLPLWAQKNTLSLIEFLDIL